ncbi:VanW family protein [Tessaracoccus oleiagri]|uniref:Putative peptidoglycan binding domain-containing protein n=1 Tax=Tessaracoccus oleiagri TaxID=686624 RepID=A0A1G9JQZ9_9ACTN|nr:VanW family protein [Tessaracoccus oleiagri]SDL39564.1 Putative peptidoglycan binding domain-containing protein [Tessaracoccus oleiagri]
MNKKQNKKWMWAGVGTGAAVLLAGGAYTAAYFVAGNQVPAHAAAGDVAIGGMSPREAQETLRRVFEPRVRQPIEIATAAGDNIELIPDEAGLNVDYEATVAAAGGGFSWNPVNIYRSLAGGDQVDIVYTVDEEQLQSSFAEKADALAVEPVDATISLTEGTVSTTAAEVGYQLQVEATAEAFRQAFENGETRIEAVGEEIQPAVTDADIKAFADGALKKAMTGPISLTSDGGNVELTEEEVAQTLTITGEGKDLAVGFDEATLTELTADDLEDLQVKGGPKNASYKLEGGQVVVVPGQKGLAVTPEAVTKAFGEALNGESRTVALEATEQEPEFTTAQAEQLKPTQVIGEYSTRYPHAAYRNTNIGKAATMVNGTVLLPGDTFSLNRKLGERTEAAGWAAGYVISGGNLVREAGGGVSQAATTLFNAAFFAGFEDVEHKPHSLYFARYPAGREATVYYGSVDLKFRNNTDYPALIQGSYSASSAGKDGSVTFRIWSRPTWDKVESTELVKSDFYEGTERVLDTDNCEPQAPIQGFTVNYKRLFYKDGRVVKEEPFRWKYNAGDRITCADD